MNKLIIITKKQINRRKSYDNKKTFMVKNTITYKY